MFTKYRVISLISLIAFIVSVHDVLAFPWSYDMWEQPAIQPYEQPVIYPEKSVTVDGKTDEPVNREELEQITDNPQSATEQSVSNGSKNYQIYCAVCHGENAKGNGIIVTKGHGFYPVDLTSDSVAQRTDGFIYAYIVYGGKVMMPAYGENISDDDAWDIVNYIRSLQQQQSNTTEQESVE